MAYMAEPNTISRAEARNFGLTRYRTGKSCPQGHVCERLTCNGCCIRCIRTHDKARRKIGLRRKGRGVWQKAHPEEFKAIKKKWRQANLGRRAAIQHARRARQLGAEGRYTQDDVAELTIQQNNQCLCGVSFDVVKYTIDHKVPLSRGGSNWPKNLQLLCHGCNSSKGVKFMCEWVVPNRRAA